MSPTAEKCLLCGGPMPPGPTPRRICSSASCQWKLRSTPPGQLCVICGCPLPPGDLALTACRERGCLIALRDRRNKEQDQARKERERRWRKRMTAVALRLRQDAARSHPAVGQYPLLVVPHDPSPLAPVPQERREAMRGWLEYLLEEARSEGGMGYHAPQPSEEASRILGEGCGRCRGRCCYTGASNMAFLRQDDIRRFRAANPSLSEGEVLEAFMSRIGEMHIAESCVFHREDGCALPREMRATTCNNFFCEGQKAFLAQLSEDAPPRAFIVSGDDAGLRAVAIADESGVTSLPLPSPDEVAEPCPIPAPPA